MEKKEIWVLDDESSIHYLVEKWVGLIQSGNGYTVRSFFSESLLLEELRVNKPSILLVDLNLSSSNGLDFLDSISKSDDLLNVKVYVVSNSLHPKDISDSVKTNVVTDYIPKPLSREDIEEILG